MLIKHGHWSTGRCSDIIDLQFLFGCIKIRLQAEVLKLTLEISHKHISILLSDYQLFNFVTFLSL